MALVYCAGKKWSRLHFLTHSRKRWLLIWGCLGLLETLAITGLLWARDIPKFVPNFPGWAGVAASSVYYALHFYNRSVVFALGFLFAAIGETAIGVAFAVLVWWVFHIHPEPAETSCTMLQTYRYTIALLASACALGIANRMYSLRPPTCGDCFAPHGIPFTYFHEGGFIGGEGFVWPGVVGNTLLVFAIGVLVGCIWNRLSQNHRLKAANS
jgi:hypothetical protein